MKILNLFFFIGLSLTMSFSSFASCDVSISQWGVNGAHLSDRYVRKKLKRAISHLGYHVTENTDAQFNLHVHYFGEMRRSGSKTVGTILTFSLKESGYKMAESTSTKFDGTERRISRKTLQKNLKEISSQLETCDPLL